MEKYLGRHLKSGYIFIVRKGDQAFWAEWCDQRNCCRKCGGHLKNAELSSFMRGLYKVRGDESGYNQIVSV